MSETSIDNLIENLHRLNKTVTPGKWWMDSHGEAMVAFTGKGMRCVFKPEHHREKAHRDETTGCLSHWQNDSDASWIAATQPRNVMRLVNELEALRAENHKLKGQLNEQNTTAPAQTE